MTKAKAKRVDHQIECALSALRTGHPFMRRIAQEHIREAVRAARKGGAR